jgi:hypothetical protein
MKKLWLYIKLIFILLFIVAGLVVYFLLRKKSVMIPPQEPSEPEEIKPQDFVSKLRQREKEIRDEIEQLERAELLDYINREYK